MTYVYILAILGTILALGGGLWYSLRKRAQDEATIASQASNSALKDAKIKTLDDRIVDSEYARRAKEKLDAKTATADTARRLLTRPDGTDDHTN